MPVSKAKTQKNTKNVHPREQAAVEVFGVLFFIIAIATLILGLKYFG